MLGFPYKVCNSVFTQNFLEFFYVYVYVLEKRGQEKFQLSLSLFYKNKVFKRHVDKKVSEKTIKKTGFVKSSFITRREGICIKIG